MYAIAVNAQVQLDKIDEAAAIFRNSVVPAYRKLPGFKSAQLMIDPTTGKSLGISFWATAADRAAVQNSGALGEQLAKFASVLTMHPAPHVYDVKVSESMVAATAM